MKDNLLFIFLLLAASCIFDTGSQLFLKSSINSLDLHINSLRKVARFILQLIVIPRIWIGFLFCTASLIIWLFVVSKVDLNFAYSLDSMQYIFITLGSMWLLKEKINSIRWLGILSIVLGIILVSLS